MEVRPAALGLCLVVVAAGAACGRKDDPTGLPPQARAPALAPTARVAPASRGAAAAPSSTVSGGEESSAATVTECPKSLAGPESVNRVIGAGCGVVVVERDYHLNNGTLTVVVYREGGRRTEEREHVAIVAGPLDGKRGPIELRTHVRVQPA